MRKAIGAILIGDECYRRWSEYVRPSWERYAEERGYEIVTVHEPIQPHPTKGPSWQKCLLFEHRDLASADLVLSLDHDIVIREGSPDICDGFPRWKLGVVTWAGSMKRCPYFYEGTKRMWAKGGIGIWNDDRPTSWSAVFERMGLPPIDDCLNAGVMAIPRQFARSLSSLWDLGIDTPYSASE